LGQGIVMSPPAESRDDDAFADVIASMQAR
jgi:hypothetical protein